MPKPEIGVYQRPNSNVWQWRIKAPKDLRHLYSSEWAHRCSLDTYSLPEANTKAARLRAEWLERFERERGGFERLDYLTPSHGRDIGRHALSVLLADEATRLDQRDRKLMLRPIQALGVVGMKSFANDMGLTFADDAPGVTEAFAHFLETVQPPMLEKLPEPPTAQPRASAKPDAKTSLRQVFKRWEASDPTRRSGSNRACELALELFERQHPAAAADVTTVTRPMGDEFKAWLQMPERGTKAKTARDRLNWLKTLLKYAHQDLELLPKQPWQGLDIKFKSETRSPWTREQVTAFCSQPLFAAYALPQKAKRAGADAAYWIPLIGLFTGARLGEICQLNIADIAKHGGVWCIDFNEDDDKRLKTSASVRKVPLHSELIRLGFLEYVDRLRSDQQTRLWPVLHLNNGKPSLGFSRWFNEVPRHAIQGVAIPDFHSLRHTVRSLMASARVPITTQDRVTGHESVGGVGVRVYTHVPMNDIVDAVEAIHYPGLSLPKVYITPGYLDILES